MKTLGNVIGWAVALYVGFFLLWVALGLGCMEAGHSATECRDNLMSQVANTIYPFIK